ncbi:IS3 family transposase [Azotobacter chroococcum]|uniref:IS3 family transposase n=1 Tax=Azotobacter chroococcum TaxID=353 RepID=A0AAP9YG06_9GAMM|nr:IS3 family transposase [Azotobacter chroococcum]
MTARIKQSSDTAKPRRGRALNDAALVARVQKAISELPSYGYRRVWGFVRRQSEQRAQPVVNAKRVYRSCAITFCCWSAGTSSPAWHDVTKVGWPWQ